MFGYKSHSCSVNIRCCKFDIVFEISLSKYTVTGLDGKGGFCFPLIHARGCKLLLVLIIVIAWQISAYTFCLELYPMKFSLSLLILLLDSMLLYFVFIFLPVYSMLYIVFKSVISIIETILVIQTLIFLDFEFWFIEDWARRIELSSTFLIFEDQLNSG